jgi:hypothetical protein
LALPASISAASAENAPKSITNAPARIFMMVFLRNGSGKKSYWRQA